MGVCGQVSSILWLYTYCSQHAFTAFDVLCLRASLESFLEPGIGLGIKECLSDTSPLKDLKSCCLHHADEADDNSEAAIDDEPPEPIATPRQEAPVPVAFPAASEPVASALQPLRQHPADSSTFTPGLASSSPSGGFHSDRLLAGQPEGQAPAAATSASAGQLSEQLTSLNTANLPGPGSTTAAAPFGHPLHGASAQLSHSGGEHHPASVRQLPLGPQQFLESSTPAPQQAPLDQQSIFGATRQTVLRKMEEVSPCTSTQASVTCPASC